MGTRAEEDESEEGHCKECNTGVGSTHCVKAASMCDGARNRHAD